MNIRSFKNHQPEIDSSTYVDNSAVIIGQVTIGSDCSIWPNTTIRGDVNWISIGNNTSIQDGSTLHVTHNNPDKPDSGFPLTVGSQVTIGHNVVLHGCTIEDNCLIGMGAIVLDGAHIEANTFIAAGALVSPGKRLESGYLYVGAPVKKLRHLTAEELEGLQYSADHYVRLKNEYE